MKDKIISPAMLRKLFKATESSLFQLSPLTNKQLEKNFSSFKNLDIHKINWNIFYEKIMFVTFYSGFKAETVNHKYYAIKKALGNLNTVAKFKEADVKKVMKNTKIIRHESKIRACIHNAREIIRLKQQYKSVQQYLFSFGNLKDKTSILALVKDLKKRYKYLGGITVNHLMADIGLNVVKPDRVLCRIFYRLGLVKSLTDYDGVIKVGQQMSLATKLPIRYIDLIFVFYGQVGYKYELDVEDEICLERKPKCDICSLKRFCNYYKGLTK
jgi:DNA-3-methyladenine glycosylase I